jgi:hypothetical protein
MDDHEHEGLDLSDFDLPDYDPDAADRDQFLVDHLDHLEEHASVKKTKSGIVVVRTKEEYEQGGYL